MLSRESCRDWKRQSLFECRQAGAAAATSILPSSAEVRDEEFSAAEDSGRTRVAQSDTRVRSRESVRSLLQCAYEGDSEDSSRDKCDDGSLVSSEMLRLFRVLRLKREWRDAVLMWQLLPWLTLRDSRQSEASVVDDARLSGQRCRVYIRAPWDSHDV